MLDLNDDRWNCLVGGYRTPFDQRPSLRTLASQQDTTAAWEELWNELHHQGDVGDASYAAVPQLVRIHHTRRAAEWNLYAIVATIELARTEPQNPELPEWLHGEYFDSLQELAQMGTRDILFAQDSETKRAILGVIAIARGLRTHGKFLVLYSEEELLELDPA